VPTFKLPLVPLLLTAVCPVELVDDKLLLLVLPPEVGVGVLGELEGEGAGRLVGLVPIFKLPLVPLLLTAVSTVELVDDKLLLLVLPPEVGVGVLGELSDDGEDDASSDTRRRPFPDMGRGAFFSILQKVRERKTSTTLFRISRLVQIMF